MSWSIFKQEMQAKMQNPNWDDVSDFADFFTKKYDECMRRGFDNVTNNTVIKGNTDLMKATVTYALQLGNQSKTEVFYNQSISLLGKGAIAYWTGAELGKVIPLIPAPGTILNLGVVSNTVTNPGVWPETPIPVLPSISLNPYLDSFILMASIHLQTISGFCNTISQYPPLAPIGPAILPWTGFKVDTVKTNVQNTFQQQETESIADDIPSKDDTPPAERKDIDDFENTSSSTVKRPPSIKRKSESVVDRYSPSQKQTPIDFNNEDDQPPPKIYGKIGATGVKRPPGSPGNNGVLDINSLVAIERGCSRYGGNYLLHPQAAAQYFKLKAAAQKAGIKWTVTSAYRSLDHQRSLGSSSTVAKVGSSPHGWAVAIDFAELFREVGGSGNPAINRSGRETSKLYRFLSNTAPEFGWYNPYRLADGGGVDEMWHWEYWGFYT
jgi:LAS superfamily LD-carboxypeptidase LdcB